jgi:hypothetical protein
MESNCWKIDENKEKCMIMWEKSGDLMWKGIYRDEIFSCVTVIIFMEEISLYYNNR